MEISVIGRNRGLIREICFVLVACMAFPQAGWSLDLSQAYQLARNGDPVFQAAQHTYEAAIEKPRQAAAGLLPSLSLGLNKNRAAGDVNFGSVSPESRVADLYSWNVRLSQPLLRFQNWAAYFQADAMEAQAEAQFRQAQQELILRVAQSYFDTVSAQEALSVVQAQLRALVQQKEMARRQFDAGLATITDIHESQSRLDLTRAQLFSAENELEARWAELEKLTGQQVGALNPLNTDVALPGPQPDDLQGWMSAAKDGNLAVQIQQAVLRVAEQELSRSRAAHFPTLDLIATLDRAVATGSVTSPVNQASDVRSGQVGLQINFPIFSGGETQSRIRETQALRKKTIAELDAARRQAAMLARQAFSGLEKGLKRVAYLMQAAKSSLDAVEANKVDYRIGTRINIDVLNAEQQLFAARRDLTLARLDALMQGLKLKAASGSLDEADLLALSKLFQTKGNP